MGGMEAGQCFQLLPEGYCFRVRVETEGALLLGLLERMALDSEEQRIGLV